MDIGPLVLIMIAMATLVCAAAGITVGGGRGAVAGGLSGLLTCVVAIIWWQTSEAQSWQYDSVSAYRSDDCRLAPLVRTVLSDRILSNAEYWRIQSRIDDLRLQDARGRANRDVKTQCPSR